MSFNYRVEYTCTPFRFDAAAIQIYNCVWMGARALHDVLECIFTYHCT